MGFYWVSVINVSIWGLLVVRCFPPRSRKIGISGRRWVIFGRSVIYSKCNPKIKGGWDLRMLVPGVSRRLTHCVRRPMATHALRL